VFTCKDDYNWVSPFQAGPQVGTKGFHYLDLVWKKRYFRSNPVNEVIYYFKSPQEEKPIGSIAYSVVSIHPINEIGFKIQLSDHSVELQVETTRERNNWTDHLTAVMKLRPTPKVSSIGFKMYKAAEKDLNEYRLSYCNVTHPEMIDLITKGVKILYQILLPQFARGSLPNL